MKDQEFKALKAELAHLRLSVNVRLDELEAKLNDHRDHAENEQQVVELLTTAKSDLESESQQLESLVVSKESLASANPDSADNSNVAKPPIFSWLTSLLTRFLPILFGWFEPIINMYSSYKKRGMGHVFLLTIGGIGLTLIGVGYLMQLMVEQLGGGAKTLLFGAVSVGVVGGGFRLHARTKFHEFAVAIVALGILIGYTTVYFSGNIYHLLSPMLTLGAYCLIALGCHLVAKKLDVNIIYSLGITGVALLPMLSGREGHGELWYLASVCLVGASSLWFANINRIPWLMGLTLAGAFLASEWVGLGGTYSLLLMSSFYLFVLYQLGVSFESCEVKRMATMLAAYTGSWVTLLYLNSEAVSQWVLAFSAFSHALLSAYLSYRLRLVNKLSQTVFALISTLYLSITAVFLLGQAHWGLAWLVEGVVLLYLSSRLNMKQAFVSAQALIAIAIGYNMAALFPYLPFPALHSFDGWVLASSILFGLAFWVRQIQANHTAHRIYAKIRSILYMLESGWLSFLILASLGFWLEAWLTPLVLVAQVCLLFWSRHLKQASIEFVALLLAIVPLYIAAHAILTAESFYLGDLGWPGRLATICVFAQMWLWAEFHRRFYPDAAFSNISEGVRLCFYLLVPVIWIGNAARLMEQSVISVLWLSPLISLALAIKIKHRLLVSETKLLTVLVGIVLVFATPLFDWVYALLGLVGYGLLFWAVHFCKFKSRAKIGAPFLLTSIIMFTGVILPTALVFETWSPAIGVVVASIYWLTIFINPLSSLVLRRNRQLALMVNRSVFLISLFATYYQAWSVCVPLAYLLVSWLLRQHKLTHYFRIGLHKNSQAHIMLALTYSALLLGFESAQALLLFGPALAIHGVIVVLQDRSHPSVTKLGFVFLALGIIKIAILDVNTSELWQKVLMFIGIGCFLLIASFWYQKLMLKYEDSESGELQNSTSFAD